MSKVVMDITGDDDQVGRFVWHVKTRATQWGASEESNE